MQELASFSLISCDLRIAEDKPCIKNVGYFLLNISDWGGLSCCFVKQPKPHLSPFHAPVSFIIIM